VRLWPWLVLAGLLCLTACAGPGKVPILVDTPPSRSLATDLARTDPAVLARGIEASLAYVRTKTATDRPFAASGPDCTWAEIRATLEHLRAVLPRLVADPGLLSRDFAWHEVRPKPLITGYYEPEIEASLTPNPAYPVPIHGLPASLKSLDLGEFHPRWAGQTLLYRIEDGAIAPFHSRAEIDTQGALEATDTPIAWTKSRIDVYFLQVQGSGRLRLPDGTVRHILYAGKNGQDYISLGKVMIERGLIAREDMSMQRIRAYLRAHPAEAQGLMNTNPSYVFFRLAESGPLGSMGQTLTPMVSLATDSAFLPLGALLALELDLPRPGGAVERAAILGLAQDRGGAIKGSRLDLFCGAGPDAEFLAGHLQDRGRVFLLLKK
jgi:membrane-bound lytic murein transglycosylase A